MDKLEKYISMFSSPEDPLLRELDRQTHLKALQPRMISGHIQGKFLEFITRCIDPDTVLEIGTFTGYSTLCLASGSGENSRVYTMEVDDELKSISSSIFDRSPHGKKIIPLIGSALEIAPGLGIEFDMVFIDGDKREYPDYYNMVMGDSGNRPLVKPGSYIIADNILWYGKVAEENIPPKDRHTIAIDRFNKMVVTDKRVENFILPVRDGLNIIRVLEL